MIPRQRLLVALWLGYAGCWLGVLLREVFDGNLARGFGAHAWIGLVWNLSVYPLIAPFLSWIDLVHGHVDALIPILGFTAGLVVAVVRTRHALPGCAG